MFEQHIQSQLNERKNKSLLRARLQVTNSTDNHIVVDSKSYLNFSSNDYLAIAQDSTKPAYQNKLVNVFEKSGAMASPLVTGCGSVHTDLEQEILGWVDAPEHYGCLLYSSGFAANHSVINTLFNVKNDNALLFQDKLNHASLIDGGRNSQSLGHCKQYRFKHNDNVHLNRLILQKTSLNNEQNTLLAVTEGVFSMDGDAPDLSGFINTVKQHNGWTMIDDAHGIGVLGKSGAGSLSASKVAINDCDVLVITFGKAIGSQGAAVIVDKQTIEYLVNFSREYIYSTHLSPMQAQLTLLNIETIQAESWRQDKLHSNIELFRQQMNDGPFELMPSISAIQPILIGDETEALVLSQKLKENGIWANAMRYPTVAKSQARLRVTITAGHSEQNIDYLSSTSNKLAVS